MKALMYHYVRPVPEQLHFFRYLHIDHFRTQLDYLQGAFGFVTRDAFERSIETGMPDSGAVLTFDDGFTDHYRHVAPLLQERGLWGIFYVPTGIYSRGKLLDVHRIHLLLGVHGGARCMAALETFVTDDMLPDRAVDEFRSMTYARQSNDEATTAFKRSLNYFISYEHREDVLDRLMAHFFPGEDEGRTAQEFYVSPTELRKMSDSGMVIGSHGVSHRLMSKLSVVEQRREIEASFGTLAEMTRRPVETFCYPYGGFRSFTLETERLLTEIGSRYTFNVEARDITSQDLQGRPQALPRYDCNLFPYGQASIGPTLADVDNKFNANNKVFQ